MQVMSQESSLVQRKDVEMKDCRGRIAAGHKKSSFLARKGAGMTVLRLHTVQKNSVTRPNIRWVEASKNSRLAHAKSMWKQAAPDDLCSTRTRMPP